MGQQVASYGLSTQGLSLGYGDSPICHDISLTLPAEQFCAIIGPNGCGKSTLLRGLARILSPEAGQVFLDGQDIQHLPTRDLARRLGFLPQNLLIPEGLSVTELVARGRYPHRRLFGGRDTADTRAIAHAMALTGISDLAEQSVETLSGGQRQRVWLALVLAQETGILLLDEPTTYLDIAHQIELMELLRGLSRDQGNTVVAVLHDLNQASRYADHLVVMAHGSVVAQGTPWEMMTPELLHQVFGLHCTIIADPVSQTPLVVPASAERGQPHHFRQDQPACIFVSPTQEDPA